MKKSVWGVALSAIVLGACGGGGGGAPSTVIDPPVGTNPPIGTTSPGGTLSVSVTYPYQANLSLYSQGSVHPTLSGFDGRRPICSLASGQLPPGTNLGSDCVLSGTPTEPGGFSFSVNVGAEGAAGTITAYGSVGVRGPSVSYRFPYDPNPTYSIGDALSVTPSLANWSAPSPNTLQYRYHVSDGSLPPGLTLNPDTGTVAGNVTTEGSFSATIRVTMTSAYGSYTSSVNGPNVVLKVQRNTFGYQILGGAVKLSVPSTVYRVCWQVPFSLKAMGTPEGPTSDFRLTGTPLPQGISLDPITGLVSGTPTGATAPDNTYDPATQQYHEVSAKVTSPQGGVFNTTSTFGLLVLMPTADYYNTFGPLNVSVGQFTSISLQRTTVCPVIGASYSYALASGPLPPGLALNSTTGTISGIPTTAEAYYVIVGVTITINGVSRTQPAGIMINVVR